MLLVNLYLGQMNIRVHGIHDFQQIGNYEVDSEGNQVRITIERDFKDALIKLDHFSHCVILTKESHGICCYTARKRC